MMEGVQNNDNGDITAMEEFGGNPSSSSMLSASIVNELKEEFEKNGMFKFTSKLEGMIAKCIDETFEENLFKYTSSLPAQVDTSTPIPETLEQATLPPPPLVLQFPKSSEIGRPFIFGGMMTNVSVVMGMMINGKPEVIKNAKGSEISPASAGEYTWKDFNLKRFPYSNKEGPYRILDQKEMLLLRLSLQFFNVELIHNLKITAESKCNGGVCQVAILAVPMQTKCYDRRRLKEIAILAGFRDVYLISSDGLAAYYWFHEKEAEMEEKNYSKEFVIIDLFGYAVVYQRSFKTGTGIDKEKKLVVKAVILLDLFTVECKEKDEFRQMIKKILKIPQFTSLIPVISQKEDSSCPLYLGNTYKTNVVIVKDPEVNYFAAKGAALLSETPGSLGSQVQNMIGTMIRIENDQEAKTLPDTILPETSVRLTLKTQHDRAKYNIHQLEIGQSFQYRPIKHLEIKGAKLGSELEVTFELNWEGIWKVVKVSARNPSDDHQDYKVVNWRWLTIDEENLTKFGCSSYEECKSMLMKVAPKVNTNQQKSAELAKVGSSSITGGDLGNSRDHAGGLRSSITSCSRDRDGKGKEKRLTKSRVIRPNDIIVNVGLKKIKLESDWVEPVVVKTEQDSSVEDFGGGGGNSQQVNLEEQEEVEVEEGVMKVEVEEENITD